MLVNRVEARRLIETLVTTGIVRAGEPEVTELVRSLRPIWLDPGAVLYRAGAPVAGVWFVRAGCIEVTHGCGPRRRVVVMARPGDVLGDVDLLQERVPPYTARCTEATLCWFIEASRFRYLIATYPVLGAAWASNLARRLSESRDRIVGCVDGRLLRRVTRLLLREADAGEVRIPQRGIAEMLGAQRTSVNKVLKELEREGAVDVGYGRVALRDVERLRSAAGFEGEIDVADVRPVAAATS